jgi:hypothetical protein
VLSMTPRCWRFKAKNLHFQTNGKVASSPELAGKCVVTSLRRSVHDKVQKDLLKLDAAPVGSHSCRRRSRIALSALAERPDSPDWLREVKYDGYRLRLERDSDRVCLITRDGYNRTDRYIR